MSTQTRPSAPARTDQKRVALRVACLAQLMVALDTTIVNLALPDAQRALHFSDDTRQWVIIAYALSFGSLLLVGGRVGDVFGRRRAYFVGLTGFAAASAIGGCANSFAVLVAARAFQGVFGAVLAPAALALLTTTFTDPAERAKAFGVFGAVAGSGGAIGLLLGGALAEYASWRWAMGINVVIAAAAAFAARRLVADRLDGPRPGFDFAGMATASTGLLLLVFGLFSAARYGWPAVSTILCIAAGLGVLAAFVWVERRASSPLLPLGIVWHRSRGGAYLTVALMSSGMFAGFLFLTFYLQRSLLWGPLDAGLGFLPMVVGLFITAAATSLRLLPRWGPRSLLTVGMAVGGLGMVVLAMLTPTSTYAGTVLPGLTLLGLGMGFVIAATVQTATLGVAPADAGVAAAMVNTSQQVGGSIGTAALSTIAVAATGAGEAGNVDGYTAAFAGAAVVFFTGALICATLLPAARPDPAGYAAV